MATTVNLTQRKTRLIELIARLHGNQDVAQRDLKNALTDAEYGAMQEAWADQKRLRLNAKEKPIAVVEYEARLKAALFEYAKAEALAPFSTDREKIPRDGSRADQRAYRRAETLLERLLEYIEEQLSVDPGLQSWFDRPLLFGAQGSISPSPSAMPRVVTSRSLDRLGSGRVAGTRSKREIKLEALELALQAVETREALEAKITAQIAMEEAKELATRRATLRSKWSR